MMTAAGLDAEIIADLGSLHLEATLHAAPGELVVVVGPNGAGKTTIVRALTGLLPIAQGRITLGGRMLDDGTSTFVHPSDRNIGVVFQDRLLFDHLSVVDNVAFGMRSTGTRRQTARGSAMRWLERLELTKYASVSPRELSGGQAQRVALARALATSPELLLLDEPLAALDSSTQVDVRRILREHLEQLDIPKILITHNPIEAITMADRIVVIENGLVTQSGAPVDVQAQPRSRYVADFIGVNIVHGTSDGTTVKLANGHSIVTAVHITTGRSVTATIHPRAITLHNARPDGSARNTWHTVVETVEFEGERVRVRVGEPLPVSVEITAEASSELGLARGSEVWVSFKATEITVHED